MIQIIVAALLLNGDWSTFGADPQRTSWNQSEATLTRRNVGNLVLRWKAAIDNQTRELNALTAPLVAGGLVIVGGSGDMLAALDAATGQLKWSKKFAVDNTRRPKDPFWLCPSAQNATPLIDNNTVLAIASDGKLHALNVSDGTDRMPPTQFTPPFSKSWSLNLRDGVLYTTTSQCCGGAQSGVWIMDLNAAGHRVSFIPASTAHPTPGAGGVAGVWGRAGVVIGKDRVFAETGDGQYDAAAGKFPDTVLSISVAGNKLVDYYTPANRAFLSAKDLDLGSMSPVVFTYRSRELVAAAGKEGVIYLLDAASIGGTDHRTPLYRSPVLSNAAADFVGHGFWGAFATWKDPAGARWLFAPSLGPPSAQALTAFKSRRHGDAPHGSIMAFKVTGTKAAPRLVPMWMSGDMSIPDPPIVANGIVFAVSTGEFTGATAKSGAMFTSAEKIKLHTGNAILYAFDAVTGRELFSSGNTMSSFTHFSGIAVSGGRVFVSTFDNTLYAFGLKQ